MKTALIGYGKMGKAIERFLTQRGHEIVCVVEAGEEWKFSTDEFRSAEAAIEFTCPAAAARNIMLAAEAGVPVVCGSTGWYDRRQEVDDFVTAHDGALLAATNFSIGVNVMMELNRRLAAMMSSLPQYTPSLSETHHIHKLDHPSGTAITLLEQIMHEDPLYTAWSEDEAAAGVIPVECERRGEVPGIHTVTWTSDVDSISITHDARSRDGFALGAVMAAEWIAGRKGIFTITQMLRSLNIL
ncbi:MAG: 4-hydroxy-tetrahydrodipicolinate reductase [Bacteroides sp.]|nr:4-hydroxy-tetrahydrodipicolinate reductase [Bacteroidales bacterium]MBD5252920.1 4-hydroxy-tetrahydrodipicolinate reductase [Barnesiella sp.]MBD5368400.1 4-hydroxy-tetrahydrodipicolinate reductase [Bacteroides sp.]